MATLRNNKAATRAQRVVNTAEPELGHDVVERLRGRPSLKSITIRLGVEQIEEARRTAEVTGVPYQTVLRQWVAVGAADAQARRTGRKRRGAKARS